MQFTTTTVSLLLAALPVVLANGCFDDGVTFASFGSTQDLLDARTNACAEGAGLIGDFSVDQTNTFCINSADNQNHINFSVKNNEKTGTETLTNGDCLAAVTTEMQGCSHGSEQDHASFHYTVDTNGGAC